jgi:vacuolar iron transporter family protein
MVTPQDITRYQANLLAERESATLYQSLAEAEQDAHLKEIYRRMAEIEQRHQQLWEGYLREAHVQIPPFVPGWRIRALTWLAHRFGPSAVLPIITSMERTAEQDYNAQPEARAAGLPATERSHARVFRYLGVATGTGVAGSMLAQLEGRHRNTGGGNALRAAVLGASDGLTSNLSLVMGVAGANLPGHTILLTGIAGLLAGALSMAIGEWLSVQSARELFGHQLAVEREELQTVPEEEREELSLIYQAKGIDPETAQQLAERITGQPDQALDTLAREELGIDPQELGGSAWEAAGASFLLFSLGAIVPVLPFIAGGGLTVIAVSVLLSIVGLFLIGAGITLTTGTPLLKASLRQVLMGLAAATITFGLGHLVGARLG